MVSKVMKFLGSRVLELACIVALFAFLPNLPPYAKFSQPFTITPALPFEGKLALNERLNDVQFAFKGVLHGPEAFAVYNNEIYTSLMNGNVVKIVGNEIVPIVKFGKECNGFYEEHICGRPLGLTFDKNGILYVADAYYGIFKVKVKTGKYEQLVSTNVEINGKKPKMPNGLALASNGDIYWTDSSTEFALNDGIFDALADGSGRVIRYNAKTRRNTVLLENVHFANGILLSKAEDFLIVSETMRSRLLKYHLTGTKIGKSEVFLDGLPGLPDNLQHDGRDGFFVPIVVPVDNDNPNILNSVGPFPRLRKFLARLMGVPESMFKWVEQTYPNEFTQKCIHFIGSFSAWWQILPLPKRLTILHVSESGEIIDSLHGLDQKISGISDAIVFKDKIWMGSPHNDFVAQVSLSKAGLQHLATPRSQPKVTETPKQTPPVKPKETTKPVTEAPKIEKKEKPKVTKTEDKETPSKKAKTEEKKPVTKKESADGDKKPEIKKEPAKTDEKKPEIKKEPAKTQETKKESAIKNEPVKKEDKKTDAKKESVKTEEKKPETKKEPAKIQEKKPETKKEPAKIQEKKSETKKEPAKEEKKPEIKKETVKIEEKKPVTKKETTKTEPESTGKNANEPKTNKIPDTKKKPEETKKEKVEAKPDKKD